MPQVGVGDAAAHFGAVHVVAGVVVFGDDGAADGLGEARPAAAGIVFVGRAEQRFAANHIHVETGFKLVVVGMREGALGSAVLRDFVGFRPQGLPQGGSIGFVVFARINHGFAVWVTRGLGFVERDVGLVDVDVAVAVRVFREVVLVVFLGFVIVGKRQVFDHEGLLVPLLFFGKRFFDDAAFGGVGGVNPGAVLRAVVVTLFVERGGVDDAEVVLQDVGKADARRIVGDFYGLGVAAAANDVFVAGVGRLAVGVAGFGVDDAGDALEVGFKPPEAAASEVNSLGSHGLGSLCFGRVVGGLRADVRFRIFDEGEGLVAGDMAFDDAGDIAARVEQHPARIDGDAAVTGDIAAVVDKHGRVGRFQTADPAAEGGGFLFAQMAGRSDADEVDVLKGAVFVPVGGFFEGGEAERAPACPVFDEGGFAAFEVGGGGGAVGCRQTSETLRQVLQGLGAARCGGSG